MALRYQMVIVWSDEDDCYLVHFPDFPEQTYRTHGNSYAEAAKNGEEVLPLLLQEDELPLPTPNSAVA
jgi:predicted RNase H-like HicB family nuclease